MGILFGIESFFLVFFAIDLSFTAELPTVPIEGDDSITSFWMYWLFVSLFYFTGNCNDAEPGFFIWAATTRS